jgi:hypothetical protein
MYTQRMHSLQFVWLKIQVTTQEVPNTPVKHVSRMIELTCRSPRTAADRRQHWGVRTEDGRPGGFLHATEPSSHYCLALRQIAFGDVASCQFLSWRNSHQVSIMDPVRINSSTEHTRSLTPQHSMSTNFEGKLL